LSGFPITIFEPLPSFRYNELTQLRHLQQRTCVSAVTLIMNTAVRYDPKAVNELLPSGTQMARQKKKLSPAQKIAKKKRREEYMTIFINGKQKRIKQPPTIDGMDVDEFIRRNVDPIWLHQNEMWEYIDQNTGENDGVNLDTEADVPF